MTAPLPCTAYLGADIFDGATRHTGAALIIEGAQVKGIVPASEVDCPTVLLDGGVLCPGFVDLQVNGGGGVLFNDMPDVAGLRVIAAAHARLGATSILPTLITDTPARTQAAIAAVATAIDAGVAGIIGLHLEGPHLSLARKGAHDPALIRPMDDADMACLVDAAARMPMLKVTLAPEIVTPAQIAALHRAGIVVSLGHSDAPYDICANAVQAGASCVTHLFNAMSQLGSREPGLVGATLSLGAVSAGLIADGIHVHPAAVKAALAAKQGPGRIFLVSDAMAVAGTELAEFTLNGRPITRRDGRLTLEDGTLAGADLDLLTALRNLRHWNAVSEDEALAMATALPAALCPGRLGIGRLTQGARADFLHLPALAGPPPLLGGVWQAGQRVV